MRTLNKVLEFIYDWIIDLISKRLMLVILILLAVFIFKAPPYTITGADGFSTTILCSLEPVTWAAETLKWAAIAEILGFTFFLDKIICNIKDVKRLRKNATRIMNWRNK